MQNRKREVIAGITTFFTMSYIIFVNPAILSTEGTGMDFNGVMTATVLLSFSMSLLMGLYAKLPFAVAPGMGINAFFTYSVILGKKIPWPIALGIVFWAGIFFVIISLTPLRVAFAKAIPHNLRSAAATGIGIFLTFIGLKNMGIIVADPITFVKLGAMTPPVLLSLAGLSLMVALMKRKSPLAFLSGIAFTTAAAIALGYASLPQKFLTSPHFTSVFLKLNIKDSLRLSYFPVLISILFTDFFDSISTFIGVSQATGLVDSKKEPLRLKEGLVVDAFATLFAGLFGTSSGTAYIESTAGIEAGGRTGLTAITTAFCFLPFLFLSPLAAAIPEFATAPVLVLVGSLMFRSITDLKLDRFEESFPAFLTIVLIPLTFSITQGILWGFISHVLLFFSAGRRREVHPLMTGVAFISIGLLLLENSGAF